MLAVCPGENLKVGSSGHRSRVRMFASGGGGGGSSGGGAGWGGGDGDSSGGFGMAAMWAAYMRLLETHPWPTKIATSAGLNAAGDIMGQMFFEKDKKFDWLRFAKFTFLVRPDVVNVLSTP